MFHANYAAMVRNYREQRDFLTLPTVLNGPWGLSKQRGAANATLAAVGADTVGPPASQLR